MNKTRKPTFLVIDDDPNFHDLVSHMLTKQGYDVWCVADPSELDATERTTIPSAILLDWQLSHSDGTTFIQPLQRRYPLTPIIFVTGHCSPEAAATSIKLGAFDFLSKPLDEGRLMIAAAKAVEQHQLLARLDCYQESADSSFEGMIGASPQMQTVYSAIRHVAPTEVNVMISGESGTGKELAALAIHEQSDRSSGPFVALNMASISKELAEATLFGHEKGAFTGADKQRAGAVREAAKGTLFLDEITEMAMPLQSKLLRFLQENTFRPVGSDKELLADTRIISATNRDPLVAVREKQLREDLYYRLNVVPIQMPPLRERNGDIPLLVHNTVCQLAKKHGKKFNSMHQSGMETLTQFNWPGNVRQLLHTLERIIVMHDGEIIELHMLPDEVMGSAASYTSSIGETYETGGFGGYTPENLAESLKEVATSEVGVLVCEKPIVSKPFSGFSDSGQLTMRKTLAGCTLEELEKQAISDTLEATSGNKAETARRLGISEKSIYNKMKRFGISL